MKTQTGKIPNNVGFTRTQGVTRKLTAKETEQQKELGCFVVLKGKIFTGNLLGEDEIKSVLRTKKNPLR